MKRSSLVALGGLLLVGMVPVPGHAQEENSMLRNISLANRLAPDLQLRSRTNLFSPDIIEDFQEIRADYEALIRALLSHNQQAIAQARAQLRADIADLRGDLTGQPPTASESE